MRIDQRPARCDIALNVGNDSTVTVAVTENGATWSSAGATAVADILTTSGAASGQSFGVALADGSMTLTLSDTQTTALGVGQFRYAVQVTKGSLTRDWFAGNLIVSPASAPGNH